MSFVYKKHIGCHAYHPPLIKKYDLQNEMYNLIFEECKVSLTLLFDRCVKENRQKCAVPGEAFIVNWQLIEIASNIGLPFNVTCDYLNRLGFL